MFTGSFFYLLILSISSQVKPFYILFSHLFGALMSDKLGFFLNIKYYLKNKQRNQQVLESKNNLNFEGVFKIYLA